MSIKDSIARASAVAASGGGEREIAVELRRLVDAGWTLESVLHCLDVPASESARILAEARA